SAASARDGRAGPISARLLVSRVDRRIDLEGHRGVVVATRDLARDSVRLGECALVRLVQAGPYEAVLAAWERPRVHVNVELGSRSASQGLRKGAVPARRPVDHGRPPPPTDERSPGGSVLWARRRL